LKQLTAKVGTVVTASGRSILMNRTKIALIAVLAVGVAAIPAYGVGSVANGRIAFAANVAGKSQVFTINPDGTGLTQVTNRPTGAGEYGLAWTPDGSSLLFVVTGEPDLIYRSAADGSGARRVSPSCTGLCLADDAPAVTRSGTKIAFERAFGPIRNDNAATVAIFTMNIDGSGLKRLTQKRKPYSSEDHKATWSPDGRRIAFGRFNTTASPTGLGAIFVINADGTHLRRLTPYSMNASNPKWSRDGTRILFNDNNESVPGKSANLYTIRADSSGLRKLTHYTGGKSQAFVNDWSPDGTQIVFHFLGVDSKGADVNQTFVMNADGSSAHALTQLAPDANPRGAAWGTAG
jgi:TolB protein